MEETYTTGSFAKKANVTKRTLRYYDKMGLLKPSYIGENGYRYYTSVDLVKLQQILSLKYIGFSLEEIFMLTHTKQDLKSTLQMQLNLIEQKQQQLQRIHETIEEIISTDEPMTLDGLTQLIHLSQFENELIDQYKTSNNIAIRIKLHQKYSMAPIPWFSWLFQTMNLNCTEHILEIGCGNGQLWLDNQDYLAPFKHLTLSDKSEGMVEDAKRNLQNYKDIHYKTIDVENIPFPSESLDVVICHHVLFYVSDLKQALSEIKRVLKPGGRLYCSTYGSNHMKEVTDLVKEFNPKITLSTLALYETFGLDDGASILKNYFDDAIKYVHDDYLMVSSAGDLIDYILSCHGNQNDYITKNYDSFYKFVTLKLAEAPMYITKDAGMFCATKK